jgi:DNA polymerase-1
MPDALRCQYPLIEEFLALARISLVRLPGEEADDVLASMARLAEVEGVETLIATSDKDIYQLVSERTQVVPAAKDSPLVDIKGVVEKTGVFPCQIVDWLALTGDAVDNIGGVPGMGPKTAAKLLQKFESLKGVWDRIDEVESVKMREILLSNRELIERNRSVVKLNDELHCSPVLNSMERQAEDPKRLRSFYERLEFHSLLKVMEQPMLL